MQLTKSSAGKKVDLPEIGMVTFKKTAKSRRLTIRIKPKEGIIVTYPHFTTLETAEKFVSEKKAWILKHLNGLKKIEEKATQFDFDLDYKTRQHSLKLSQALTDDIWIQVINGLISVEFPLYLTPQDELVKSAIKKGIEEAWRIEARHFLPKRTEELARLHGFSYTKTGIRNSKTRWGSCSAKNSISLSLHLMRLPDYLIDHVILHELTHTIHKNHGDKFWKKLGEVDPETAKHDKELNSHRITIY
ncbi:MAG: M48 family metallopeptidase [Bacteroidetes bacterium]|nr:M48 family metallopeptidase [Bacteroidota bacterium]